MNATGNGRVVPSSIMESQSVEKSIDNWNKSFDKSDRSFSRSDRSFDKSDRSIDQWKSFDKSEITEKSIEIDRPELSERSMDFEPSITISVQPIEPDEDISFAFSIEDEIPFIDEDSLTSLSKNIHVQKTAIPLSSFFKEKVCF